MSHLSRYPPWSLRVPPVVWRRHQRHQSCMVTWRSISSSAKCSLHEQLCHCWVDACRRCLWGSVWVSQWIQWDSERAVVATWTPWKGTGEWIWKIEGGIATRYYSLLGGEQRLYKVGVYLMIDSMTVIIVPDAMKDWKKPYALSTHVKHRVLIFIHKFHLCHLSLMRTGIEEYLTATNFMWRYIQRLGKEEETPCAPSSPVEWLWMCTSALGSSLPGCIS